MLISRSLGHNRILPDEIKRTLFAAPIMVTLCFEYAISFELLTSCLRNSFSLIWLWCNEKVFSFFRSQIGVHLPNERHGMM